MRHWFPSVPVWIWILVFMILIFLSNFFSVKIFAESEFWFAAVKVAAIVAFIILGGLAVVFVWMAIALCQLKFRQKWLKEGHTEDELKFKTTLYPFTPWFAFIASLASCLLIWFYPGSLVRNDSIRDLLLRRPPFLCQTPGEKADQPLTRAPSGAFLFAWESNQIK